MNKWLLTLTGILISCSIYAQQKVDEIFDKVNATTENIDMLSYQYRYNFKSYNSTDTTINEGTVWLRKQDNDEWLGAEILCRAGLDAPIYDTYHKGNKTWISNYEKETTTLYKLDEEHWDGFNGNFKANWAIRTPFMQKIGFSDAYLKELQETDDTYILTGYFADDDLFTDNCHVYHINKESMLPIRCIITYKVTGEPALQELLISHITTDEKEVAKGLKYRLPFPVEVYEPVDPSTYDPLPNGTPSPGLKGWALKDSSDFDLDSIMQGDSTTLFVLDFWYQSCAPCIMSIPYIDTLVDEYEDKGLKVIGVNSVDGDKPRQKLIEFLEKRGARHINTVLTDRETERTNWKNNMNPGFYFIKNGVIVDRVDGFAPQLMPDFRDKIDEHLDRK